MKQYFISAANFQKLARELLKESTVAVPVKYRANSHMEEMNSGDFEDIDVSGFRTVESLKSYLFMITEKVSRYFGADEPLHGKPLTIIGVRGCDTEALDVLDSVFTKGDFSDPFYSAAHENALIIGADCTDCGKTCFCTMVKGQPYPVRSFDINLSMVNDGYVVEVGSPKGEKLVKKYPLLFLESTTISIDEKENNRKTMIDRLEDNNKDYRLKLEISTTHKRNIENKIWRQLTKDCVECSACNFICPTCTCFLLLDQNGKKNGNERYKIWDACLKSGYQKVAGGANPRGRLFERLQNRYHCKFDYSFDRLNRYTCVGCGRCIDGCAGNIDMRKIFVELEKQAPLTAKLGVI